MTMAFKWPDNRVIGNRMFLIFSPTGAGIGLVDSGSDPVHGRQGGGQKQNHEFPRLTHLSLGGENFFWNVRQAAGRAESNGDKRAVEKRGRSSCNLLDFTEVGKSDFGANLMKERYHRNAPGDFYVENGKCITCCAP
jgi:hypothetical protein